MSNQPVSTDEKLLTYKEVSELLKVSIITIKRYRKRLVNPLPVIYLKPPKHSPRVRQADFNQFIQNMEQQ